jgi:hypothetical protein
MAEYYVTWKIILDADSPREAARTAFAWLQEPGCSCNVFETVDYDGVSVVVDLSEEEGDG